MASGTKWQTGHTKSAGSLHRYSGWILWCFAWIKGIFRSRSGIVKGNWMNSNRSSSSGCSNSSNMLCNAWFFRSIQKPSSSRVRPSVLPFLRASGLYVSTKITSSSTRNFYTCSPTTDTRRRERGERGSEGMQLQKRWPTKKTRRKNPD